MAPKAILVHNASAGIREPSLEDLTAMIEAAGYRVKYRNSKAPDLEAKLDKQGDLVVAAGGDGTIAKVAKILLSKPEQGAPLAILPIGTSNNIALSLGITEPPEALIPRWNETPLRKLSHGIAHAHWGEQRFIEGVGLGSLAEATTPKPKQTKDRSAKGRRRRITEGRIAFRHAIKHAKPERLYVTVDGTRIEDEVVLIEILNIAQVGPRLRLAPNADPGDNLLDVAYVTTEHRNALLAWLDALIEDDLDAGVVGPPPVAVVPGAKVTIAWNGMDLRIDDKFPLMPGQATAPSADTKNGKKKKTSDEADEKAKRDKVDLVTIEIAERQLEILAPAGKANGVAAKRAGKKEKGRWEKPRAI
ncbi:diacylglycerol/lipid kinase family protein [Dongia sp.]|uniref:diacylglycerol/lipid kinase family protein n=1 Tax=Dongia sp. TaxID=1977262 RepID=UPI003752F470